MSKNKRAAMIKSLDSSRPTYERFGETVQRLIGTLLTQHKINPHSITVRVKSRVSLEGKLRRKRYADLSDITDIVGLRIITHLANEVDKVAEIVEKEFAIDEANSVDKRKRPESDRIGYLSLHKVCGLSAQRLALTEYTEYCGLKCEIQIRSILQHAWAEIEHDLGYKATTALPDEIRRRFSKLAALLELADDEFIRLSADIQSYIENAKRELRTTGAQTPLDSLTLAAFLATNAVYGRLLEQLKSQLPGHITFYESADETLEVERLISVNVSTIQELESLLMEHQNVLPKIARAILDEEIEGHDDELDNSLSRDWGIFILHQLLTCLDRTDREAERLIDQSYKWGTKIVKHRVKTIRAVIG